MNDTDYVALVDTTRDELRERIAAAQQRFDRLVRGANPLAPIPDSRWTVQQAVAHVLTVAHRYRDIARTGDFHRAGSPAEVAEINQAQLEAVIAPVPKLADELQAVEPEIDSLFDTITSERSTLVFHAGVVVDDITAQTNWLGELLLHGRDVARAAKSRWDLPERDMLLIARGMMQIAPAFVRSASPPRTNIRVTFHLPGARPYLIHIHERTAEVRESRPSDRPDAVLRAPASTFTQLLYQRITPLTAARRGLMVVGGRRPWRALRLQSYFERP